VSLCSDCFCQPKFPVSPRSIWPRHAETIMATSDARARKAVDGLYEGTGPAPDGPQTAQDR